MAANYKRKPLWYKDAIIYELNIKGFKDSTGSGIGDFNGLIEQLDYLQELGVTAIWILPFYPSPLRDDGYDISDYYTISEVYGDVEDFKRLLDEAHSRNLQVITELVINHTSDQHPWFQRARRAPIGSVERDYYVWSDDPNKYKDVRIIFQDFETSNWTWDAEAKQYYWHRFYSHQPDLNFDNPKVQEEIFEILDFWVTMGIDGFRLDAIPYLYERENTNSENLPETHAFLKKLRKHIDEKYDNVLFLAEANMWPEDSASYFGDGDECHMNYHFPLMPRMYMSLKMEDRHPITDIFDQTPEIPENCQWATFLRNHDELTLEMVTDEERDYMRKNYAADPKARINLGIRRRLAPLLENDRNRIELMNILLFSLPGTPVLYYGDEIGMGDNYYLGDRDGVRTPMQWNANQNAGFSEANPQSLYLPVIIDPEYDYKYINVERQQRNTNSLLWWMKRAITTRQRFKAFGRGKIKFLESSNTKVLTFIRSYEEEEILVLVNLSRFVEGVSLDLSDYANYTPIEIFGDNEFPTITEDPYFISLAPHGYYWFSLQSVEMLALTPALLRSPEIEVDTFEQLFTNKIFTDEILKKFFLRVSWFGNKGRKIEEVKLVDTIPLINEEQHQEILLVEVKFRKGLPELFQLPVVFKELEPQDDYWVKEEVIGVASVGEKKGLILDAFYDDSFRLSILNDQSLYAINKELRFDLPELQKVTESQIRKSTIQYVSVEYKEGYYLKFYRRIDTDPNPDYELNHWLTKENDLDSVPDLLGGIFYKHKHFNISLATIQELVNHQGYGWDYVVDTLKRVIEGVTVNPLDLAAVTPNYSVYDEIKYEDLPDLLKSVIEPNFVEKIEMMANRTAQIHLALTNADGKNAPLFEPELFSLHYQRSLFSALKALVRTSFTALKNQKHLLSSADQKVAEQVLSHENDLLTFFKRIYKHKFEASKIRIHGNLHLEQIMMVGEDVMIDDFDGTYDRPFSERRLRKSPLVDVAAMLRSIHYASSSTFIEQNREDDSLKKMLNAWYTSIGSFFLQTYKANIRTANIDEFIPDNDEDFNILMEVFTLERALKELYYELNYNIDRAILPMEGILHLLETYTDNKKSSAIWGIFDQN